MTKSVFILLALCAGFAATSAVALAQQKQPGVRYWIIHGPPGTIEARALATDPRTIKFFSDPSRIVLWPVNADVPAPSSWHIMLWRPYASLAKFQSDIENHRIAAGVQVVGYDLEKWPYSPDIEKTDPIGYTITFAQLAHAHGYKVLVTPAINLTEALYPGQNKYTAFVNWGFAKAVAPYADFFHVQAQGLQKNIDGPVPSFTWFLHQIVAQVHDANPNAIITVGIATTRGRGGTSDDIVASVHAADPLVSGYWLNIVGPTASSASDALTRLSTPQP